MPLRMTRAVTQFGAATTFLVFLLLCDLLGMSQLTGQPPSTLSTAECKQFYDERRYVEARNCFSQILTQDPKNLEAQTYYRLSNLWVLGLSKSEDASHAPGTPEIPLLQNL